MASANFSKTEAMSAEPWQKSGNVKLKTHRMGSLGVHRGVYRSGTTEGSM